MGGGYLTLWKLWNEQAFSDCTVPPDIKETKLGSSNQEAFPTAGTNTDIV